VLQSVIGHFLTLSIDNRIFIYLVNSVVLTVCEKLETSLPVTASASVNEAVHFVHEMCTARSHTNETAGVQSSGFASKYASSCLGLWPAQH